MRFKASSALLQMEDTEIKLANLHEFKQASPPFHTSLFHTS